MSDQPGAVLDEQPRLVPTGSSHWESERSNEPPTPEYARRQKLYRVAMVGDWEAAKKIFDRDDDAKTDRLNGQGMTALHVAANCGRSEFVEKLVSILDPEDLEMADQLGRNALHHVALASGVNAAKAIMKKNESLAQDKEEYGYTPLFYAARWRHPSKNMEMLEYLYSKTNDDVYTDQETAPSLIVAITTSGCYRLNMNVPKTHNDAIELVHFVCKELQKKSYSNVMEYFLPPNLPAILHVATRNGVFKLVEVCLAYFPDLIWYTSNRGKFLIHVAVKHRRIEIFNHIMSLIGKNAGSYAGTKIAGENNILHLAALLAPTPQLHSIPGPAFQMQRELEWFKAVETLVYKEERDAKNSDDKTPLQLFFEQHNDLIKDAKEWIKDTSNSCMVVAALVATVAFASMITVPGGNDSGTGLPVLSKKEVFIVFSISNALSMITSAIALLMFLSLQTSRFTTEDFLATLPRNLVRGLLSLFFAVATMMTAFGTAIGMALQTRVNWAYIPITVVACIPAIIFTRLQLPLLFQTVGVTSGPVIYTKQKNQKMWLQQLLLVEDV